MLLGVLINQKNAQRIIAGKAPSGIVLLAEEAAYAGIATVFFTASEVDWWEKSIDGFSYSIYNQEFVPGTFGFPDIIYNRATFSPQEKSTGKLYRDRFHNQYKIPYINSKHTFGKWETFKSLSAFPEIRKHLPETKLYYHPVNLETLIEKHTSVYIKGSGGSQGKNIFKIEQAYEGLYIVSYRQKGKNCIDRLTSQGFHGRLIKGRFSGQKVIIQQGIDLACYEGCPFDLRLLLQKNRHGDWVLVDRSVRIAAAGSVITNVTSGGRVRRFEEIIPQVFPDSYQKIQRELQALALGICQRTEDRYGPQGELGIDIALDVSENLWLIEINAKPSKISVRRSNNKELIHLAYSNPVQYARYVVSNG